MKNLTKFSIATASITFILALSANSFADDDATKAEGEKLYKEKICHTCHGDDGNTPTNPTYPKVAGQSEAYVKQQLLDFKSGARSNSQAAVMKAMLASVTEENITVLAAYLASLPAK